MNSADKISSDAAALREMGETIFTIMQARYQSRGISGVCGAQLCEVDGIPTIMVSLTTGGAYLLPQLPEELRKQYTAEYRRQVREAGDIDLSSPSPLPEAIRVTFAMAEFRKGWKKLSFIPIITIHIADRHIVCHGGWEPYEDADDPAMEIPLNDEELLLDICIDLLDTYLFGADAWTGYAGRCARLWLEKCADLLTLAIPNSAYCELGGDKSRHFAFLLMLNSEESLSSMKDGPLKYLCSKMLTEHGYPNGYACFLLAGHPDTLTGSCMLSLHGPVHVNYWQMPETAWRALREEPLWSRSMNACAIGPASFIADGDGEPLFERKAGETACAILNKLGFEYAEE